MSIPKLMVQRALSNGMMPGSIRYGNADIPCTHGHIDSDRLLVAGGMSKGAEVPIIVDKADVPENFRFVQNADLQLTAADGMVYRMKVGSTGMKTGNPWFIQFTGEDISQRS